MKVKARLLNTNKHLIDSTNLAREAHLSSIHCNRLCNILLEITGNSNSNHYLTNNGLTRVTIVRLYVRRATVISMLCGSMC